MHKAWTLIQTIYNTHAVVANYKRISHHLVGLSSTKSATFQQQLPGKFSFWRPKKRLNADDDDDDKMQYNAQ